MPDLRPGYNLIRRCFWAGFALSPSLRANGSRECAPDDRLREAIHRATNWGMDCFVAVLLAMTVEKRETKQCLKKACSRESGYWLPAAALGSVLRWGAVSSNSAPN